MLKMSVIIINYNQEDITLQSVQSVKKYVKNVQFEIIIIDNHSKSIKKIKRYYQKNKSFVRLIVNNKNYGFAKAVNMGIRAGKGDYFLLLNNDAFFINNVDVKKLIKFYSANREKCGLIGFKILNKDLSIQYSIYKFPSIFLHLVRLFKLRIGHELVRNDQWYDKILFFNDYFLKGVVLFFNKKIIKDIGFFDENIFLYGEETEFQYRAVNRGYKIIYYPFIELVHLGSQSTKDNFLKLKYQYISLLYFFKKYNKIGEAYLLYFFILLEFFLKSIIFLLIKIKKAKQYILLFLFFLFRKINGNNIYVK